MPTPPTLRNFSKCSNPTIAGTSKTLSLTCSAGDYLTFYGLGEDVTSTLNTPTGGSGLSWTLQQSVLVTGDGSAYLWTCQASAGNSATTITVTAPGGSTKYDLIVYVWDGSTSAGIGTTANANSTTSAAPANSITTTSSNSALCCAICDFNASAITTRTWRTINSVTPTSGNGLETEAVTSSGSYTAWSAYWTDAGAAGAYTTGMTAPATQAYSIISAEILPLSSTGGPNAPITGRPGFVRPGPGAAVTLDHGTVIQSSGVDLPIVQVQPSLGQPPARRGDAVVVTPRAEPSAAQNQPIPEPCISAGRPPAASGSAWIATPRGAGGPVGPPQTVVALRPQLPAATAPVMVSRADSAPAVDQPATPTFQSGGPATPRAGAAVLITPRADPDPAQNQPAPPVLTVTPIRPPTTAISSLTSSRGAAEPFTTEPTVAAPAATARPGSTLMLVARADPPAVQQPPQPVLVVAARTPTLTGATSLTAPRTDPPAVADTLPPAVIVSSGRFAAAGSVQLLHSVAELTELPPTLVAAAGVRPASAGSAALTRPTFTPPPPVLYLRPPIQSPGIRLRVAGSAVLQRLTEQTGHVCPPPTVRPFTGTTANSAGDVTPRPYSGVTPAC